MKTTDPLNTIIDFLSKIRIGEKQHFGNLTIYPVFFGGENKTDYLTMKEALMLGVLDILEKDSGGSVPELRAINKGKKRILLVDGEELEGAKQNRILNTSILLKKMSETIIPVSCTESGRWNYKSKKFFDSDAMAPPDIRKKKVASVSDSLFHAKSFQSDQREVWDNIEEYFSMSFSEAPTRAMKDGYKKKLHDVEDYISAFHCVEGQRGMIVGINGRIEAMEYVSSAKAFKELFLKLLRSYSMEADRQKSFPHRARHAESVDRFFARLKQARVMKYKSPGHGYDHRLSGRNLTGNSLIYRNEVIHFACFAGRF